MSSLSAPRWRSVSPDAIASHQWDGDLVVRNERTGSTHLLDPLAGCVLQILLEADAALSIADVAAALREDDAVADTSERAAAIATVLSEFKRLGLAEAEAQ
jgi:PqqD family protein of HPr-rel-A system